MIGIRIANCWGEAFCISTSCCPPWHISPPPPAGTQWGHMKRFLSSFCVDAFIATLSDVDLQTLCHHFTHRGQMNRAYIERALLNGELTVHPEIASASLNLEAKSASPRIKPQTQTRSLISIRTDIKLILRQIVDQERIETQQIEKHYQQKNHYEKGLAHLNHFANGLYNSGAAFLTWLKEVDDVLSLNQRLLRIIKAAMAAEHENQGQRYQIFKQTLAESEKKELVEALGFDPSNISVEQFKQLYALANLIYDDQLTQIILTQFVKDYTDAQHSLEWSEFSGGAAFEVILTALLALATGGVGALASLGAQARKMSQLKKLGGLLSELAEQLKDIPKEKPVSLRQLKEVEERKQEISIKKENTNQKIIINDINTTSKGHFLKEKTPKDSIDELTAEELRLVDNVSTFKTKGVSQHQAEDWLINNPEGREYFETLRDSVSENIPDEQVFSWATDHIRSGSTLPKKITINEPLIKIIPKGNNISDAQFSPFFTTKEELLKAQNSGNSMWDAFGLPVKSDAFEYDVYELPPKEGAIGFISTIAPTDELGGKFMTKAGANQVLVPSKNSFKAFRKAGTVRGQNE